jgi:hypothetical protein
MTTKQEWLEYFEAINGRQPSSAEFLAAKKKGDFGEELVKSPRAESISAVSSKKKSRRWIWLVIAAVAILLGLGAGAIFGLPYLQEQAIVHKSQAITETQITSYLKSVGYIPVQDYSNKDYYTVSYSTTSLEDGEKDKVTNITVSKGGKFFWIVKYSLSFSHGKNQYPAGTWTLDTSNGATQNAKYNYEILTSLSQIPAAK